MHNVCEMAFVAVSLVLLGPPGQFTSVDRVSCEGCPAAYYLPRAGSTLSDCISCRGFAFWSWLLTFAVGSGKYAEPNSVDCLDCPAGIS